jgi:tetratricopeptide (TPR) repeat protein
LFAEAVRADPSNAPSWQAWAVFEREQRNYGEARRLLEEGLQHVYSRRGKGLLHSTLGGLFARRNDLQAAEEHFRKALEYNDQDALTHYYFAVYVLLKTNRREEACVHLRRAEALGVEDEYQRRKIEDAAWYNGCIGA